jgi:hypothetical protein
MTNGSPPSCPFCNSLPASHGTVSNGTTCVPSTTYRCLTWWSALDDPAWHQSLGCQERAACQESVTAPHVIPLAEQLRRFDACADEAFEEVMGHMRVRKDHIIAMARERLIDGFREFGDEMWHWLESDSVHEGEQEGADHVNYYVPLVHNRRERKVVLDSLMQLDRKDWERGVDCC